MCIRDRRRNGQSSPCDTGIPVFLGIPVLDEMVGRACAHNVSAWDRAINTDIIRKNHRREGRPALCPNAGVATSRGLLFLAGRIVGTLRRCVGWSYWSETLVKSVAGGLLRIGMRHDHDMTNRRLDAVILAGGCAHRLGGVSKANLRVGTRRLLDVVLDAVDGAVSYTHLTLPTILRV